MMQRDQGLGPATPQMPGPATPQNTAGISQVTRVLQARDARVRGKRKDPKPEQMSLLTQTAQELTNFVKEFKETVAGSTPAPFMKAKLDRRQARARFSQMTPEEHQLLARKWGVRLYVKVARQLGFEGDNIPIGGQ